MKLLVVYHSQSGSTERLAEAVEQGALRTETVTVIRKNAKDTSSKDLLECTCVVLCSPEYFGYMAGALKDLFDRTYEDLVDRMIGTSYAVVVSAGNDGTGALTSVERIVAGLKLRKVQEPLIIRGIPSDSDEETCRTLGETLAAGVDLGIY